MTAGDLTCNQMREIIRCVPFLSSSGDFALIYLQMPAVARAAAWLEQMGGLSRCVA
jgi:hypothetical protein